MSDIKQITRLGYEYQDLIGIENLFAFYKNKNLYEWIQLEYIKEKEFSGLDDVVCKLQNDDKFDIVQVKYTVNSEKYFCDWKWLTNKGKDESKTLVQKWSKTILAKFNEGKLNSAVIVTNRRPDELLEGCLEDNKINWQKISSDIQQKLIEQIGSEDSCQIFFNNCTFDFRIGDWDCLETALSNEYIQLVQGTKSDWCFFKEQVRRFSIQGKESIKYGVIERILNLKPPKPMNQDFSIPDSYIPPNQEFHNDIINKIKSGKDNIIVITGSPGVGKSTYISYLKDELSKQNISVVRHHYYLSPDETNRNRYLFWNIKDSLLEQMNSLFKDAEFPNNTGLKDALCECGEKAEKNPFVIIIDGLDHVWREEDKKDALDILFNDLFPIPQNVVLLIGTQPVSDDRLPSKLVKALEREKWSILPFMSKDAISKHLEANGRIQQPDDYHGQDFLSDISEAFLSLTNGHPLHLIFSVEYALNNDIEFKPYNIRGLPACPDNDIKKYYHSLITSISGEGKMLLDIFVASEFYGWFENDLQNCLMSNGVCPITANSAYKSIAHILYNDGYFIKPFHESIIAYIKEIKSDDFRISYEQISNWLDDSASEFYQNIYAPFVNAKIERYEKVDAINREYVAGLIFKGYPLSLIVWLLGKSEQISFERSQYARVVELRHIKVRLMNLLDFQTWKPALFLKLQSLLSRNMDLKKFLLSNLKKLKNCELVAIGERCTDDISELERIIDKRVWRLNNPGSDGEQNEIIDVIKLVVLLEQTKKMYDFLVNKEDGKGLLDLFNQLCINKKTIQIKNFLTEYDPAFSNLLSYIFIVDFIKYADNERMNLTSLEFTNKYKNNPYLACYYKLKGLQYELIPISLPVDRLNEKKDEHSFSGRCHDVEAYFHSLFFEQLFYELSEVEYCILDESEDYNGCSYFVALLLESAKNIARMINNEEKIKIHSLLNFYEEFNQDYIDDNRWHSKYRICTCALTRISIDLYLLCNTSKIEVADFCELLNKKCFDKYSWFEDYFNCESNYLSKDSAKYWISLKQKEFSQECQETVERVNEYLEVSYFALFNNLNALSKDYFNRAIRMSLGYSVRKDYYIYDVLNSVEYCIKQQIGDADSWMYSLIKIAGNIDKFTDSKGTYDAKKELCRVLLFYDEDVAIKYYKHLVLNDNWRDAEDFMIELVNYLYAKGLENTELLFTTIIEPHLLFDLKGKGDIANRILIKQENLLGAEVQSKKKDYSTPTETAKIYNYADFPVDKIDDFIEQLKSNYDYKNLPKWFAYWRDKTNKQELLNLLEFLYNKTNNNYGLDRTLDDIFELSVEVEGKTHAYKWIVRAHIMNSGWSTSYSDDKQNKKRLERVADLYPEKWMDYIKDTSENKYQYEEMSDYNFVIGFENLVYFLIQLKEYDLAVEVTGKMVKNLEDDMFDLPLKEAEWLNED